LQTELEHFGQIMNGLANLSNRQLSALQLGENLGDLHNLLQKITSRCENAPQVCYEYLPEMAERSNPHPAPHRIADQLAAQSDRAQVNLLTNQLLAVLARIQNGRGTHAPTSAIPQNLIRLQHTVGAALDGMSGDLLSPVS
jgi:hypothetical protein